MTAFSNSLLALNGGLTTRVGTADTIQQDGGLVGTPIGASSPSTGDFTQLSASSSLLLSTGGVDFVQRSGAIVTAALFPAYGYNTTSGTAKASGTANVLNRNRGFTASTVTTFVAGVNGVSNPTFTNTDAGSSSLLAAGDIVVISNAINPNNDGIYVVNGVSAASFPQTVTIKGVGTTAPNANTPWVQTQFTAGTANTATATKVDLFISAVANGSAFPDSVGTAYAKGTFLVAYAANATESDFTANGDYAPPASAGSAETLQAAYDLGATITTASSTPIAFTLTSGGFTVDDGAVDFGGTTALTSFDVDSSGGVNITSAAASSWAVAAATLALSTTTSGDLTLTSAGLLALTSTGDASFEIPTSSATAWAVSEGATDYIVVSTNVAQVAIGAPALLSDYLGFSRVAGAAITQYALVAINGTAGKVFAADADGSGTLQNVIGVCSNGAAADADPANVATTGVCPVLFDGAIATSDIGKVAYLSATAGQATLTAPSAAGSVITRIGVVAAATGATTASVFLAFQFVAVNP